MTNQNNIKQHILLYLCLLVGVSLLYGYFVKAKAEIVLHTNTRGKIQLYWKGSGDGYKEKNSAIKKIRPRNQHYTLRLTNLLLIDSLRLDPINTPGTVVIADFKVTQFGLFGAHLRGNKILAGFAPVDPDEEISLHADGLHIIATGKDPKLELKIRTPILLVHLGITLCVYFESCRQ